MTQLSSAVLAQVRDDWQVLRIFVPEEEIGSLVPNDYNPVEIEDLAGALAREASRRSQLKSNPHIAEALYLMRCSAESLVSDHSRWSIKSPVSNPSFKLEEISFALRNSGSTPVDDKPLLPSLRYATDGTVTISKISGDTNYWFGMSSVPNETSGNQSIYDLRLPAATLSRMLISAPESMQITSPDVIVSEVSNPRQYLPDTWPSLASTEGQRWFLLHLSGKSKIRLIAEATERNDAMEFQHFVRRSSLVYSASEKGLALSADFEVERLAAASSFILSLSKSLRVRSVTVNGADAVYRNAKSDEDASTFEVPLNVTGETARLRVEAAADTAFPFDDVLPTIELARAFSWEGRTSLVAEDSLACDQLQLVSRVDTAKPRLETTTIGKRWVADWIGVPPRMRVSIGRVIPSCETESLTRLTIQEDWIAATTNLRIVCSSTDSNELRLRVGNGWFIDDLTIEKSEVAITSHVADGEAGDIVLTWDRLNKEISINLQLVAHLPKAASKEQISLQAQRVVTVASGSQRDYYAIEKTGRYQIEADPILQRLELSETELAPWQASLLSRLNTPQLFQGIDDSIPPIVMNRSSGTYTAKVVTAARLMNGQLKATYTVEVLPTAGAIDTASCTLTLPSGIADPVWRASQELSGEQLPIAKTIVSATREDVDLNARSQVRFDFQLPDTVSDKFLLQCELLLPIQGSSVMNLPLVTMPVAMETWLILPRNLELPSTAVGMIALPSSICCDSGEFARTLDEDSDSMVGYRYDPSIVTSVELRPTSLRPDRGAWIWSDVTAHQMYNDGRVAHQADLQIFAPESLTLTVDLPSRWVLNRIYLDGIASEAWQRLDSQRVLIGIPQGKHVRLSLRASSQNDALEWYSRVELPKPTFSLESLNSSELLWLQPGRVPIHEFFGGTSQTIAQRFSPISWWMWLAPSPSQHALGEVDADGWRKFPLHPLDASSSYARKPDPEPSNGSPAAGESGVKRIEVVSTSEALLLDRSSLCAMCVAILLAGAGLSCWLLADRLKWWWLCLTLTLVAILLVPANYVGIAQLVLLCFVCGAFARLIRIVTSAQSNRSGALRRGSTIVRTGINSALILLLVSGGMANAQDVTADPNGKFPLTYGVLIPLNSEGQLSAKHVYAPQRLMNLLNNSDTRESDEQLPQILGAKYMLKISSGTSLTTSYVQEFTAEFDLQFNSIEFPLRLPFKMSQLQLLRGSVSGQGVLIGTRLQQSADAITYRPPETGRVRLRLQLTPATKVILDRTGVEVEIPRIASSALEVIADDTLDLNAKSIGLMRRLTPSSWSAELGPTDKLQVDWPTRPQRIPTTNPAITQADTWLHISEGQVVADCQIRISGARALPKQLHIVLDAAWEPVGSDWNDVKLISDELSSGGNRRIYTVNRDSISDRTVIRTLVVPRNEETVPTLAIPYFSLSESSSTGRTLAMSVSGKSRWKLIGSEFWNRMNGTGNDLEWDSGKPNLADLWRIPNAAQSGSLQRISGDASVAVEESFELNLLSTKATMDYRANWSMPSDTQVLKLEVPFAAEPRSVRVNGSDADYLLTDRGNRKYMLIDVARIPVELRVLEVQMQLNAASTEPTHLPRIILKDADVSKSVYQVNCGAELMCTLINDEKSSEADRIKFAQPIVDTTLMLSTLTSPIGTADLGSSHRESILLPTLFQVTKRLPVKAAANVIALTRTEQGWRARVEVLLAAEKSAEFVFFDVPTAIRDSIESSGSPFRVASSGATGRSTLCLVPQPAEAGMSRAMFDFRLSAPGSSQSLAVPDILFHGPTVIRPVLALPSKIDGQPVRWLRAGRRLPDDWRLKSGLTVATEDFVFFEMNADSQQQTTWQPSEAANNPAEILFAWAVIAEDSQGNTIGTANYWINPNNHLDIALGLPHGAQLIGIRSGESGAVWHAEKPGVVRVLMQPNYLPVQLRVYVRWPKPIRTTEDFDSFAVQLPTIDAGGIKQMPIAVLSKAKLIRAEMEQELSANLKLEIGNRIAFSQVEALRADHWSKLLLKSLPVVADLREDEYASWRRNWRPEAVGLQATQKLVSADDVNLDTVMGFWSWYSEQTDDAMPESLDAVPLTGNSANLLEADSDTTHASNMLDMPSLGAEWYLVNLPLPKPSANLTLNLSAERPEEATTPLAIAAALLCIVSFGLYQLLKLFRQRTHHILATYAWIYWAFLAVLAWLLLPVAWPSLVIAISSIGMLASQLLNFRRRQLATRR